MHAPHHLAPPDPVRAAIDRLAAFEPDGRDVVSCYVKLEPRDKTRGKYLIKVKNRARQVNAELERRPIERAARDAIAADLDRVLAYLEDPERLPGTRALALFACSGRGLFEAVPLPLVHRSRLAVAPAPLITELVALEEEFGTIAVAVCDRTSARFFSVTAYDITEFLGLTAPDAHRGARFHGERRAVRGRIMAGGVGEHNHHQRIKVEKHRHYAAVADQLFRLHTERPLTGVVLAGVGVDAAAVLPHLHSYLHDHVLGVVKLNPKHASAAEVREATLSLREERERAWERAHAAAVKEGLGTGWAVNGPEPTLRALRRGQVRTLLADGQSDDPRIDDAVEEALHQRSQVDVLYDERARRSIAELAALLRFRR
jgi:peptide chain release factor subunit 1